jgi:hypothetical protein
MTNIFLKKFYFIFFISLIFFFSIKWILIVFSLVFLLKKRERWIDYFFLYKCKILNKKIKIVFWKNNFFFFSILIEVKFISIFQEFFIRIKNYILTLFISNSTPVWRSIKIPSPSSLFKFIIKIKMHSDIA